MGLKRKRFRCGWRTLWVLAVCMVEIGRVRVKTGNAPIEQKISAYPPQADICAFVSTSLETKRAARQPSQGSGRPKCKREGVAEDRFGSKSCPDGPEVQLPLYPRKRTQVGHRAMSEKCQQQTHAPRQIAPYRSACRCGRARLIRSIPLSESPRSSASHFLIAGSERSTPIL